MSLVSVIVPNYNHAIYLPDRLSSIINQTYSNYDAILLDDSSDDNSVPILQDLSCSHQEFNLNINTKNSGSTFSQWNKGVSLSNNDLIWIAESDDLANPNLLASLIEKIQSDSEIVLAYCQSNSINEQGIVTGSWISYTSDLDEEGLFSNDFTMDGKEYIQRFLIHKNTIPNASAVLFRKSAFDKVGGAPIHLKTNGDWLTWLKMLCFGKIAYVAAPLNYFRHHDQSVIAKAHQKKTSNVYLEQYDSIMRKEFTSFLMKNDISISLEAIHMNRYYISLDIGNQGLFSLKNGDYFKGWKDIFSSTFFPKFKSGFLKKALRLS